MTSGQTSVSLCDDLVGRCDEWEAGRDEAITWIGQATIENVRGNCG